MSETTPDGCRHAVVVLREGSAELSLPQVNEPMARRFRAALELRISECRNESEVEMLVFKLKTGGRL